MPDFMTYVPTATQINIPTDAVVEVVYLGRSNPLFLDLREDEVLVDLASVTQMKMFFDSTVVDSGVTGGVFDWDVGSTGRVKLLLGGLDLTPKVYQNVPLIAISPAHPNGKVWMLPFQIQVIDLRDPT